MIDAWGKIPEGILSGHVNSFGDFDECLGILSAVVEEESEFRGRYCDVWLLPGARNNNSRFQTSSAREAVTIPELVVSFYALLFFDLYFFGR